MSQKELEGLVQQVAAEAQRLSNGRLSSSDFYFGTKPKGKGYGRTYSGFILSKKASNFERKHKTVTRAIANVARKNGGLM